VSLNKSVKPTHDILGTFRLSPHYQVMRNLLMLSLIAAATTAVAADDPTGWSKAHWGMTDNELIQAFGGQVTRFDLSGRPAAPPPAWLVGIASLEIAGRKFSVTMIPDGAGHLDNIVFSVINPADHTDSLAQDLENLLASKYGRPWKTEADNTTDAQWSVGTTVIQLSRTHLSDPVYFRLIVLRYHLKSSDPI